MRPHHLNHQVYQPQQIGYRPLLGSDGKAQVQGVSGQELSRWRNSQGPPDAVWSQPQRSRPRDVGGLIQDPSWPSQPSGMAPKADGPGKSSDTFEDIVQFSSAIYIVEEEEKKLRVDVMRLGKMKGRVSCRYSTVDGSAKAGKKYTACSGEIVMEDGETDKSFEVWIIDDDLWSPTLEFKVKLTDPQGCVLGIYLHTARVKIVDNDKFPSNRYEAEISRGEEGIAEISGFALFWEYFRLNYNVPGNRPRTIATVIMDQWHNVYYFFTLYINIYLVDTLFEQSEDTEKDLFLPTREATALLIGISYVGLHVIKHIFNYIKIMLDLDGRTRVFLQCCLFRKYLNYSEDSRAQVLASDMQIAITGDTVGLASAYSTLLEILQIVGKLIGSVGFVLAFTAPSPAGTAAIFGLPAVLMVFGYCRDAKTQEATDATSAKLSSIVQLTQDVCTRYRLVADYAQRPQMNDIFEELTNAQKDTSIPERKIKLMNNYFPAFLGSLCIGGFIILEAKKVLDGETKLGNFLATVSIFGTVSSDSGDVYALMMALTEQFSALRTLTTYFNLPTDLLELKANSRNRRERTKEARQEVLQQKADPSVDFKSDLIPLKLSEVGWKYKQKVIFDNVNVEVPQGKLIAVVGNHGSGKNTLLRMVGHTIFPPQGRIFVPTHLRILHVSQEPMLLGLSAWRNLTFGCPKPITKQEAQRVADILDRFGMEETKEMVKPELDKYLNAGEDNVSADVENGDPLDINVVSSERSDVSVGCLELWPGPDMPETPEPEEVATSDWQDSEAIIPEKRQDFQESLTYTEKVMMHLARAFIMNPEVLIIQRPLHHFNREVGVMILKIVREHVKNRGLCCDEAGLKRRRPRTVFFSPETKDQASEADVIWQIDKVQHTVYEVPKDKLVEDFTPYQQKHGGSVSAAPGRDVGNSRVVQSSVIRR